MGSQGYYIKELNDKEEMELIVLIGNLKTHEIERKAREEMAPQKKKMIAFKSTLTISDDDEEEEDDEELSLLVKNVRRMYNKAKFNNRRRWQGKKRRSYASIVESRATWLRIVRRPKVNLQPPRSPTKRRLSKLHGTRRMKLMKK